MYKADILDSVSNYYSANQKLVFYKQCIDKINDYKFESNGLLSELQMDEYLLESVRITVLSNINKYHIYLSNKKQENCTNYLISTSNEIKEKLLHQLVCITDYNNIMFLEKKQNIPKINFENSMYVIISDKAKKMENSYELKNLYEISGYIFGVEIFNILKYQRLDRITDFIRNGGEGTQLYTLLNKFAELLKTYDWQKRERIIVQSGAVFQTIGLTYTRDIDLLVLAENSTPEEVRKMDINYSDDKMDIDAAILANDGEWYTGETVYKYKKNWFTYILPSLGGAEDIFEVFSNPKYYFCFMGVKFMSLDLNVKRFLSRSNANSLTDLVMLEKINNYIMGDRLCVPNMTVRQGKIVVFNEKIMDKIQKMIKEKAKEYYNYNISIDEVKKIIKKCNLQAFDIYKGKIIYDPDTSIVKRFHLDVKQQIFYKYCKDANYLLDVGSGQLTDAQFWNKVGIKNVVGIEPSIDSIKKGMERLEKYGTKTNIKLINGVGNADWKADDKYKVVFNNKYDVVTFQYTLHYMMYDIETVMKNISQVIKRGSKIIITCMDGKLIHNELNKYGKIEVRNSQEPIFAIFPQYDHTQETIPRQNDILVYFKGAYGVASGSIEPLVDIDRLIKFFINNGFKLLEMKKFLDYNSRNKDKMSSIQKRISYYYTSLIFEYVR